MFGSPLVCAAATALLATSCASSAATARPSVPLDDAHWGEDLRADEVRRASGERWFGAEDVPLAVPRVVFFLPARAIQIVSIPIRGGLRFTQKHHVVENVGGVFAGEDEPATSPSHGAHEGP